jgi:hypothetical protein
MRRYNYRLSFEELELVLQAVELLSVNGRERKFKSLAKSLTFQRDNWKEFEKDVAECTENDTMTGVGI